jgi:hypothetical protein
MYASFFEKNEMIEFYRLGLKVMKKNFFSEKFYFCIIKDRKMC